MNSLKEMMDHVGQRLIKAGYGVINERLIPSGNGHALGFFHTECGHHLTKWNVEFKHAGSLIRNLNGGKRAAGQTIPLKIYEEMQYKKPTILFNTPKNNIIYSISFDEFTRLSELYEQNNGEWVRVICSKDLSPWTEEKEIFWNDSLDKWHR